MYLNFLLNIDEIYLFFILLLFSFTIINSSLKNKYNVNFKASLFTTYFAIILNLIYSLVTFYIIYNIVLSSNLLTNFNVEKQDIYNILITYNQEYITDLIIKGILSISVFI